MSSGPHPTHGGPLKSSVALSDTAQRLSVLLRLTTSCYLKLATAYPLGLTTDTRSRQAAGRSCSGPRNPWDEVDDFGIDSMPPGRFVSGVAQTSLGKVGVVGVCIPWSGSRTEARRGQERKMRWEDHARYLAGLTTVLEQRSTAERLIVMGDFNQIVGPGNRAPAELQSALGDAFPPSVAIATSLLAFQGTGKH